MLKHALFPSVLVALCSLTPSTHAETLSNADREALTEQLDFIINKGKEAITKRQAAAYRAYRSAMGSESAALELYLDCVEKVDFEEAGKKGSDFRSWKSKNKERLSEPGFRCALRHQLNWLVMTIEAARLEQDDKDLYSMASKVNAAINNIYDDAKKLDGFQGELEKDVVSTVFARAYGFGTYRVKEWPTTPLNIADVYEKAIFPAYREQKEAGKLRTAWKHRIKYEELKLEHWTKAPETKRIGLKRDIKSPAYYKFIEQQRPKLIWQMEVDVFNAGDERGAATRMFSHIKSNIGHNDTIKWVKQLHKMVAPEEQIELIEAPESVKSSTSVETVSTQTTQATPTPTTKESDTGGYIELPE